MDLNKVRDYAKKVEKMMPLDKFKNYFVKIVYVVHKVVRKDGSDVVYGVECIVANDVHESYHGREYDFVDFILEMIKEKIGLA